MTTSFKACFAALPLALLSALATSQTVAATEPATLLNQQTAWHAIERQLQQSPALLGEAASALQYQLTKTRGRDGQFAHYQTLMFGLPVVGQDFVLVRDGHGQVQQGLGPTLLPEAVATLLKAGKPDFGRYFAQQDDALRAVLQSQLLPEASIVQWQQRKALKVHNQQLLPVIEVYATYTNVASTNTLPTGRGQQYWLINGLDLQVLAQRDVSQNWQAGSEYVAAGGIGGNEKIGQYCFSPSPQSMTQCSAYQFDGDVNQAVELQFIADDAPLLPGFNGYPFIVTRDAQRCQLANPYVQTLLFDKDNSEVIAYDCPTAPYEHTDSAAVEQEYYDYFGYAPENDAHFNAGLVMQYYHQLLQRLYPSQSGLCQSSGYCLQPLKQRVKADSATFGGANANWDGQYVNYGNGNFANTHYAHTTLHVVAHEASHAITEWNSGLASTGEAGALNEAFSDIAAIAIADHFQQHAAGSATQWSAFRAMFKDDDNQYQTNRKWWYGWDVIVPDVGGRYFEVPSLDGQSIDDARDYNPSKSKHANGGAYRKFFYELVKRQGWQVEQAFQLLLSANVNCWHENIDFTGAANCLLLQDDVLTDVAAASGQTVPVLRSQIDQTLHSVGLQGQASGISNEPLTSQLQYDTLRVTLPQVDVDAVSAITLDWGDQQEHWTAQSGTAVFPFLQRSHSYSANSMVRFHATVTQNGQQTEAFVNGFSRAAAPACAAQLPNPQQFINRITVGSTALSLANQSYQWLNNSAVTVNKYQTLALTLPSNSAGVVTVLADLNRDGLFSAEEALVLNQAVSEQTVSVQLPEAAVAGKMLLRVALGGNYQFVEQCGYAQKTQVIDLLSDVTAPEQPLQAKFSYSIVSGNTVQFQNDSQANAMKKPSYQWQFGNGQTSTAVTPAAVTYPSTGGNYTVTLTARYNDGSQQSDTFSQQLTLNSQSQCAAQISQSQNASAVYIEKVQLSQANVDSTTLQTTPAFQSSGYLQHQPGLELRHNDELNVDFFSNRMPESTVDNLLRYPRSIRATVWLDGNNDELYSVSEANFSDLDSEYRKVCDGGSCYIKVRQFIRVPRLSYWKDKLASTVRIKLEEQPKYAQGYDGCKTFNYGEVEDIPVTLVKSL